MDTNKILKRVAIVVTIAVLIPILLYVVRFYGKSISNNPSDWSTFANYLSNTASPIIGFASLFVLGYLTIVMSKQDATENRRLFILQQKMVAYQELVKYLEILNLMSTNVAIIDSKLKFSFKLSENTLDERFYEIVNNRNSLYYKICEFYITILNFKVKYGHLFKYDFDCENYLKLKDSLKEMNDSVLKAIKTDPFHTEKEDKENLKIPQLNIFELYPIVVSKIREELYE